MSDLLVRISCDLYFKFEALPSWYRLYVNDELFVERTPLIGPEQIIHETVILSAPAGRYLLWARGNDQEKISIKNIVVQGPASVEAKGYFVIE